MQVSSEGFVGNLNGVLDFGGSELAVWADPQFTPAMFLMRVGPL